jgi:Zn-dependent protease
MEIMIFVLIILLFSAVIHEIAHGAVANSLGDPTAKLAGRLTLNPLKHIDPIGSVALPLFLFLLYSFSGIMGPIIGWAKPVPINPINFKDKRWGVLKVSLAGPFSNILVALFLGILIRLISLPIEFENLLSIVVLYNFFLAVFNLMPIPPLDGSWILFSLLPARMEAVKAFLHNYSMIILLVFIFFGLDYLFIAANYLSFFASGRFPGF